MKKNKIIVFVLIILILSSFLRLYRLEDFITFLGDQGRDALIIKNIATFQHFPAIGAPSSVGQIYLGPFYYYLMSPWLLIFRFHPVGLGYGVAIMSIIGLGASFFMVKRYLGNTQAVLFLILSGSSYTLIELSRFSWNPNLLPLFTFMTIYFLYEWLKERTWYMALLFGAFFAFAIQLHYLSLILFVPLGLTYFVGVWMSDEKKSIFKQTLFAIGSFAFFSIPLVIFDLRHNFLNTNSFIRLFTEGKVAGENSYIERLLATSDGLVQFGLQLETTQYVSLGILLFLCVLASYFALRKKHFFILIHVLTTVLFVCGFAALNSPRHYHYFGPIYLSLYLVLISLPCMMFKRQHAIATSIVITVVFVCLQISHYYYFSEPSKDQIAYAKKIAQSFDTRIAKQPIQIVPIPTTETDGHFRYFLDLAGYNVLPNDSPLQAEELFVICFSIDCQPLDDPQWQIAAFYNKALSESWDTENVTIYKIVHK